MKKSFPLITPAAYQRYECHMCGACCRAGFAVVVTDEERERIQGQGWEQDPEFPHRGKELFIRQIGGQYILNQNDDGSCIFLDEKNACRIHARYGEPAKPFACRPYPFVLLAAGHQIRVSLRFDCPSVCGNQGRPLPEHRNSVASLAANIVPEEAAKLEPPLLRPGVRRSWEDLLEIAAAFDTLLTAESLDVTRRLLVCADLYGLLAQYDMAGLFHLLTGKRVADLQGRALKETLGELAKNLIRGVTENPLRRERPRAMLPMLFRQAAGLYGRLDRVSDVRESVPGKLVRLGQRFTYSLRLIAGAGRMPRVRPGLPRVPFGAMERSFGIPDAEAAEALIRYYRVKFGGLGFCGRAYYGWPFLEGAGALLLTYPLILWFARLFAAGEGKESLDADCVQRAIRVVDRPRGVSIALSLAPERFRQRFLSDHENLSTLIVWYGT
jgi:lysine-N-methylase